jgi:hypothetical protein
VHFHPDDVGDNQLVVEGDGVTWFGIIERLNLKSVEKRDTQSPSVFTINGYVGICQSHIWP